MQHDKIGRIGRRWLSTAVIILGMLFIILNTGQSSEAGGRAGAPTGGTPSPAANSAGNPEPCVLKKDPYAVLPAPCEKYSSACAGDNAGAHGVVSDAAAGASGACSVDIMLLGDSITMGWIGVVWDPKPDGKEQGYRRALNLSLKAAGYDVDFVGSLCHKNHGYICSNFKPEPSYVPDFDTNHEGHPGASTWLIRKHVSEFLEDNPADIVLLHIGTNDLFPLDLTTAKIKDVQSRIKEILDKIYAVDPDTVVFLARIIPRKDLTRRANVEKLNDLIDELALEYSKDQLKIVDLETAINPETQLRDDAHPTDDGYKNMAAVWDYALQEYLSTFCDLSGGKWADLGKVSDTFWASEPALALGSNGTLFIAWSDYSSVNYEIYVKEWKNSTWVEKGSNSAAGDGISSTAGDAIRVALTLDSQGKPVAAWEQRMLNNDGTEIGSEIYVLMWGWNEKKQREEWIELNGSASGGGISSSGGAFAGAATRPVLASGPEGAIVAWHNYHAGKYQIYVKRWNDNEKKWEVMGAASGEGISKSTSNAFTPSVAVRDGQVFIAWADTRSGNGEIYIKRWNEGNKQWEPFSPGTDYGGGVSQTTGNSFRPSLAIYPDGRPVVAWEDNTYGNYEIYLKEWNNSSDSWVEKHDSAQKGGISSTTADSTWPSLAIDELTNLPVVTWREVGTNGSEVYLKRWNNKEWEQMAGSASGGGISDCGAIASKPSLVSGAGGAPLAAWDCGIAGTYGIHVRRWQQAGLPKLPPGTPDLAINHNSGAPGSYFTFSGSDFPAGGEAIVTANGKALGPVVVDGDGRFDFILDTAGADEGYYLVTAAVNPKATAQFELAEAGPIWPKQGTAPVIDVPPDIAFSKRLFVPVSMR